MKLGQRLVVAETKDVLVEILSAGLAKIDAWLKVSDAKEAKRRAYHGAAKFIQDIDNELAHKLQTIVRNRIQSLHDGQATGSPAKVLQYITKL